jgi:hypothetical protein
MRKVWAASVGVLLSAATAAYADNYSRERDGGESSAAPRSAENQSPRQDDRGGQRLENVVRGSDFRDGGRGGDFLRGGRGDFGGSAAPAPRRDDAPRGFAGGGDSRDQGYQGGYHGGRAREQAERSSGQNRSHGGGSYGGGSHGGNYGHDRGHRYDDGARRGGFGYGDRHRDGYDHRHGDRGFGYGWGGYGHDQHRYDWGGAYRDGYRRHGHGHGHWYGGYYGSNWNRHRWRSPYRYVWPRGYHGYYGRSWQIGLYLPRAFYAPSYYIDYTPYGLEPPPYGCEWVRVDDDILLVEIETGLIVDILYDFYY